MDSLKHTLKEVMAGYAVKGLNGYSVLTMSADQSVLTIVSTANVKGKRLTTTSLIATVENEQILVEHDINSEPLVDALVQAGIPRSQIILAYAGEPVPESV